MSKRVLILGAGFAGIAAARRLSRQKNHKVSVTLVNRHRWNVFWPLLPDLISARVLPAHISYQIEPFCKSQGVDFVQAEVEAILPWENKVETQKGPIHADYFIVCLGCETNYYGNKNIQNHAPGLKSLNEALRIRQLVRQVLEGRRSLGDSRGHIIVVGGGYTGFETASHIVHLIRTATGCSFRELRKLVRVEIVEKASKVLGNTSPSVQHWAEHLIQKYGVEIKKKMTVVRFENGNAIRMSDGTRFEDAMVVWNAGVAPGPAIDSLDVPIVHGGRLKVDRFLRVGGLSHVFAAGDAAGPTLPGHDQPLRMSVLFSEIGGRLAAANVLRDIESRPLRPFDPVDMGYVIPLAPGEAIGSILGHDMHGHIPFLLHYVLSVARSFGWENRAGVAKDLWAELLPDWLHKKEVCEKDFMYFDREKSRV